MLVVSATAACSITVASPSCSHRLLRPSLCHTGAVSSGRPTLIQAIGPITKPSGFNGSVSAD